LRFPNERVNLAAPNYPPQADPVRPLVAADSLRSPQIPDVRRPRNGETVPTIAKWNYPSISPDASDKAACAHFVTR